MKQVASEVTGYNSRFHSNKTRSFATAEMTARPLCLAGFLDKISQERIYWHQSRCATWY